MISLLMRLSQPVKTLLTAITIASVVLAALKVTTTSKKLENETELRKALEQRAMSCEARAKLELEVKKTNKEKKLDAEKKKHNRTYFSD